MYQFITLPIYQSTHLLIYQFNSLSIYQFINLPSYTILARLTVSPFYHLYRFFGPVCFNILTFYHFGPLPALPFYLIYHFANFTILSLVSFTILPFASIFGPSGFNIVPFSAPLLVCHFYHFYQLRSIGYLT